MAKIFSNIAKTTTTLKDRYEDSTVNSEFTTFVELRDTLGDTPGNFSTIEIRRIEDIYDLYQQIPANLQPQTYTYSELLEPVVYTRGRSSQFYRGFPLVNPKLTATNFPVNDTLIEIYPDQTNANDSQTYAIDRSLMLQDSQSLPLVSGPRDVTRIGRYLLSGQGLRFLSFQKIIQRGNTFGQSRQYDETSIPRMVLNYASANLFDNALQRVSRITLNDTTIDPNLAGRIQRESVITAQSKLRLSYLGGASRSTPSQGQQNYANLLDSYVRNAVMNTPIPVPGILRNATTWLNNRLGTNFSVGTRTTLGQIGNRLNAVTQFTQALSTNIDSQTLGKDQTAYDQLYIGGLWPLMKQPYGGDGGASIIRSFENEKAAYLERARESINNVHYNINSANPHTKPYEQDQILYRSSADYTDSVQTSPTKRVNWAGITTATYLKDDFNLINNRGVTDASDFDKASNQEQDRDYIKFIIKVPGVFPNGIYFRAFISDMNHSTNGEYESVRYIGRPERFITYRGMSRAVTLSMYLIAFSREELNSIWTRANMLNKLMYPVDNSGGYMTAPLAKITLGNVLVDQPGYMENVDMRFTDIPWDIDRELPQAIQLNMRYNIIEDAYITQNNTSAAFAQLFNRIAYPAATPPSQGPQPQGSNPNSTANAGNSQPGATSTVSPSSQPAARPATSTPTPGQSFAASAQAGAAALAARTSHAQSNARVGAFSNLGNLGTMATNLIAPWRR